MAFQIQKWTKRPRLALVRPREGAAAPVLAPASVYLLADNLDAALAAGEDLQTSYVIWNAASDGEGGDIVSARETQRAGLSQIRSLEMILVARVLKSRERTEELGKRDIRFRQIAQLYNAGTALLIEAAGEFGDPTVHNFETGNAPIAYLRTRGLIAADASAPYEGALLHIDDSFLIARRIRLGALLDLVAMFLDTLETHYDLFMHEPDVDEAEIDGHY
jgi:hypothetical protein